MQVIDFWAEAAACGQASEWLDQPPLACSIYCTFSLCAKDRMLFIIWRHQKTDTVQNVYATQARIAAIQQQTQFKKVRSKIECQKRRVSVKYVETSKRHMTGKNGRHLKLVAHCLKSLFMNRRFIRGWTPAKFWGCPKSD